MALQIGPTPARHVLAVQHFSNFLNGGIPGDIQFLGHKLTEKRDRLGAISHAHPAGHAVADELSLGA
ncbi:hypothetical protein MBRU_11960 [Mycolicibacterium brumae DSM 44177]|nr:hypothetical protein MBRU_11960 [Mycolicibacterium brumae DSM 44177]